MRARVLLGGSLLAVAGAVAGTLLAASPASAGASQTVMVDCRGNGQVRPAGFVLACADGNAYLNHLHWANWGSEAFSSGVFVANTCKPSCVQGHFVSYPVLAVAWRPQAWPKHAGRTFFTQLTLVFTGRRPGNTPVSPTYPLSALGGA
ncbi:MAG TPA: hypothetical protein VGS19_24920 [Streptosporangiaceae bacterium]|nr:hypothetical protein [Streptosporangiaceae bacterium]